MPDIFTQTEIAKHKDLLSEIKRSGPKYGEALAELYKIYCPVIRGRVRRVSRRLNPILDDIVQDVMLRVVERSNTYDPRYNANSWIMRITRNLCIDLMRREKVREVEELPLLTQEGPEVTEQLHVIELQKAVRREVGKLPKPKRRAVELFYFDGMNLPSIKAATGLKNGTISNATHVARETLRQTDLGKYL